MTIPDDIRALYQDFRGSIKEAALCDAIRWAVAGWLENEHKLRHWVNNSFETCDGCRVWHWLAEADRLLKETEGEKDGR